ncbi:MAG: alkaline phosphatase family protein [Acholeplasma sp.]|nr:alkaline phosphatase family protein [Acholeplasma sp.]
MKKPDYHNSILNVSNTLLEHYGVNHDYPSLACLKPYLIGQQHIMLILMDGMGMNILKNLNKNGLLRQHVVKPITSVYPPTTVAATTSVISGVSPFVHGHVGWTQYNRFIEANTVLFLNENADKPYEKLSENFKEVHLKYETIMSKIQKANPKINVRQFMPSFAPNGFDSFKDEVDALIELSKTEASFSYTYWTEPDLTIHKSGTKSAVLKALLFDLENEIKRLYESVSNATIIVIADHGLIDVKTEPLWSKTVLLDMLYRKPSIEPRSTAFFVKLDERNAFKKQFKKSFGRKFKLLTKEKLYQKQWLGTGEKHPLLDDFIGDFMAIAHKKYMFGMNPMKGFNAHHAGIHKKEMMVPLIVLKK